MSDRVMRLAIALTVSCALACAGTVAMAGAKTVRATQHRTVHQVRATHHRTAHKRAHRVAHHDGHAAAPYTTALNVALAGTATASTQADGSPASNAIDGDATTQWCSTEWTGNVTVDLGSVRTLNGFGLTLGSGATTALVNISAGTDPSALSPVPDLQQQTPEANTPEYWPLHGTLRARYVKIDVTDNDGTPPCIGEFRTFSSTPSSAIPDRGADLSFEPQEEAAGARFTDGGVARLGIVDPQPPRAELRPPAPVGGPAARLQQPGLGPEDGPADQGRGGQAVPGHPLLRLLGRPAAPGHSGGVAGTGSAQLTDDGPELHPLGLARLRGAGHAGGHGLHRQRDPQRLPVAGGPGGLDQRHRLEQPRDPAEGRRGGRARGQPVRPQDAGDAALRRGRQQRRQHALL